MSGLPSHLTPEDIDAFGRELDAIRDRVFAEIGATDARYIRDLVRAHRTLEITGRGLLMLGFHPLAWLGGVAALTGAKILDIMEIGHNVMHGQYDWMGDPELSSQAYEWDWAVPAATWRYSHNFLHHTYTNVVGVDRDLGYGLLRVTRDQRWLPRNVADPLYTALIAMLFEWGVTVHQLVPDPEQVREGASMWAAEKYARRLMARKAGRQFAKDYLLFPLLSGPLAARTLVANALANLLRNLWAFAIIFCGHFPEGIGSFSERDIEGESRGAWYIRQLLGSGNISGGPFFHVMTGNLSHQIEHHLFPDMPSRRYQEVAGEVRALCERYGLPYTTGPLRRQVLSFLKRIVVLSAPDPDGERRETFGASFHRPISPDTADSAPVMPRWLPEAGHAPGRRARRSRRGAPGLAAAEPTPGRLGWSGPSRTADPASDLECLVPR